MKGHGVPLVVYEDEAGNLVTASTPGASRKVVGEADAHLNEQGDLVADGRITEPTASKTTEEMMGTLGPFSLAEEAEQLTDMVRKFNTIQARNAFLSLAESAEKTTRSIRAYSAAAPYYVKVSHKDKNERRAKNKQARKTRKKNRG